MRHWPVLSGLTRFQRGAITTLILLAALLPSARLAWNSRDMPLLGSMSDDGIYLVCAKSLAEGSGYRILSLPSQPFQTKYPPLYSWLLSLIWRIDPQFPLNLPLFTLFTWALLPAFAALAWLCFKDIGLSLFHRTILCAALVSSSYIVLLSTLLMSDLLFSCLLLLSLALSERAARPESKIWLVIAAGLVAGLAYLTRRSALPLLFSAPFCFWIRGQHRRALAFAAAMTPAMAMWALWIRSHQSNANDLVTLFYTNYAGFYFYDLSWKDVPVILWENMYRMIKAIRGLFIFTGAQGIGWLLLTGAMCAACVSGIVRLVRRYNVLHYALFACAYMAMLLAWQYRAPTERFLVPLFPLLLAGFSIELGRLSSMLWKAFLSRSMADRSVAVLLSAVLCALSYLVVSTAYAHVSDNFPEVTRTYRADRDQDRTAYRWISANIPGDAAFLAGKDTLLFLHSGRHAASQPQSTKPLYRGDNQAVKEPIYDAVEFAREQGLTYYYVERYDLETEARQKLVMSLGFHQVYNSPGVNIYQSPDAHATP